MIHRRKYDENGTPTPGAFEVRCDGCGARLQYFTLGRFDLCSICAATGVAKTLAKRPPVPDEVEEQPIATPEAITVVGETVPT